MHSVSFVIHKGILPDIYKSKMQSNARTLLDKFVRPPRKQIFQKLVKNTGTAHSSSLRSFKLPKRNSQPLNLISESLVNKSNLTTSSKIIMCFTICFFLLIL